MNICKNCKYWYSYNSGKWGECKELENVLEIYLSEIITIDRGEAFKEKSEILSIDTPLDFSCSQYKFGEE